MLLQVENEAQMTSEVGLIGGDRYCDVEHVLRGVHMLSVVAVANCTMYSVIGHTVTFVHTRSVVNVGGTV